MSPIHRSRTGNTAVILLLGAALLLGTGSCGGPATTGCPDFLPPMFTPDGAVISNELFAALPQTEQDRRHRRALGLLNRARAATDARRRLTLLDQSVSADPGLVEAWLELAGILRRVASDARIDEALDRAGAALARLDRRTDPDTMLDLSRRLALLRAWHHYDRGEWRKSYRWAKSVYDSEPGNDAARVITALLEARMGNAGRARGIARDIRLADPYATEPVWINACLEISRGLDREAFSFILTLLPQGAYQTECWRDMARIAERLEEWSFAGKWYAEAAAATPAGVMKCLGRTRHMRLAPGPRASDLPLWLGLEGAYGQGSLSAYTALAYARFQAEQPGPRRDRWAGEVINAAGTCIRLGLDIPWARKVKGLVFAEAGDTRRALHDLRRAANDLREAGYPDAEVETALGRQLILIEGYDEALEHLRRAVDLDPLSAQAWSDMGLVLVTMGDQTGGQEALTRAIDLDPGLAAAWYNRGLMHMHRGDLDRAAADMGEAARLAPDNQDIAHLLQKIQQKRQGR